MTADLTNKKRKDTYKSILHLENYSQGLTESLQYIYDGDGTASPVSISLNDVKLDTALSLKAITTPSNPVSGTLKLYFKNDNKLYTLTSGGVETELGAGGGGGGGSWGSITGTLSDQTDLQDALDLKADISSLASVATSGSYLDLSNTPIIPTQYTDELAQDAVGGMVTNSTFVSLAYVDGTPSLTASLSATGTPDNTKYLRGDNTWATPGGASLSDGDYGDVTVSSSGTVMTIDNDVVTYAKMQNISATDRLLGRDTAGAGDTEELTVSGGLEFTGSGGIQRSALTGDVTASAGSNSTTIANDAVTYAKIQNVSATDKLLGRVSASAGDIEEITCTDFVQSLLDDTDAPTFRTTLSAASSGANTDITSVYLNNTGLKIKDTNASHGLIVAPGSDITEDRTLTVTTGDASRTLTISADATLSGTNTGDQNIFSTVAVSGQSNVVADTTSDTITFAAGDGMSLATDATTDTITFTSTCLTDIVNDTTPELGGDLDSNGKYIQFDTDGTGIKDSAGSKILTFTANSVVADHFDLLNGNGAASLTVAGTNSNIAMRFRAKGSTVNYIFEGTASGPATLMLSEDTDNGTNHIDITVPASITTNRTHTLPAIANGTFYVSGNDDVAVADGGTGRSSHTAYMPLCGGTTTTGAQQSVATGTRGYNLRYIDSSTLPEWGYPTHEPGVITSSHYYLAGQPWNSSETPTSFTFTANTIYYLPINIPYVVTILSLNCYVTTNIASQNINMAIFTPNSNLNQPNTIVSNSTTGSISAATTGLKTGSLNGGSGIVLNPGLYFAAIWCSSSLVVVNGLYTQSFTLGIGTIGAGTHAATVGYTQSQSYSATFPSVASLSAYNRVPYAVGGEIPAIYLGT